MQSRPPTRERLRRRAGGIRFLTFSGYRRLPLLGKPGARNVFVDCLYEAREKFDFALYAWVVMPEHVRILLFPRHDIAMAKVLQSIKLKTSIRILKRWKELRAPILSKIIGPAGRPRLWQPGGGFDRNVRDHAEFRREIRYCHQNPLNRGLVEKPQWWDWSSCRWWMGIREPNVCPCDPPLGEAREWAAWIEAKRYM